MKDAFYPHDRIQEQYTSLQVKDKEKFAKFALSHLSGEFRLPFTFEMGDRYHTTTSSGEPLILDTVFRHFNGFGKSEHDVLLVSAYKESGDLVGHHITGVKLPAETFVILYGGVAVLERGNGYAMPIELAHFYTLQNIANQTGVKFIFESYNENLRNLAQAREAYQNESDPLNREQQAALLQGLELEQQRWQTLFSGQGKLGFLEDNVPKVPEVYKHISPQGHIIFAYNRTSRKEIWLSRREYTDNGRTLAESVPIRERALVEQPHLPSTPEEVVQKFQDAMRT